MHDRQVVRVCHLAHGSHWGCICAATRHLLGDSREFRVQQSPALLHEAPPHDAAMRGLRRTAWPLRAICPLVHACGIWPVHLADAVLWLLLQRPANGRASSTVLVPLVLRARRRPALGSSLTCVGRGCCCSPASGTAMSEGTQLRNLAPG